MCHIDSCRYIYDTALPLPHCSASPFYIHFSIILLVWPVPSTTRTKSNLDHFMIKSTPIKQHTDTPTATTRPSTTTPERSRSGPERSESSGGRSSLPRRHISPPGDRRQSRSSLGSNWAPVASTGTCSCACASRRPWWKDCCLSTRSSSEPWPPTRCPSAATPRWPMGGRQ